MSRVSLVVAGLLIVGVLAPMAWSGAVSTLGNVEELAGADSAAAPTSPAVAQDASLVAPVVPARPLVAVTLPHDPDFSVVAFDDFEWCSTTPCSLSAAQPVLAGVQTFSYSVMAAESWVVGEGGVGGGNAATAVDAGGMFEVQVRAGGGGAGAPWRVTFAAKAPMLGSVDPDAGGLNVLVTQRVAGAPVGPVDCLFVPTAPTEDGYAVFVPTNPLCTFAPVTTEVWLRFTAQPDADGVLPEVAIDDLLIERVSA